jgi:hypothetical protein
MRRLKIRKVLKESTKGSQNFVLFSAERGLLPVGSKRLVKPAANGVPNIITFPGNRKGMADAEGVEQPLMPHAGLRLSARNLVAPAGERECVVVADHALFDVTENRGQFQVRRQGTMLVYLVQQAYKEGSLDEIVIVFFRKNNPVMRCLALKPLLACNCSLRMVWFGAVRYGPVGCGRAR